MAKEEDKEHHHYYHLLSLFCIKTGSA